MTYIILGNRKKLITYFLGITKRIKISIFKNEKIGLESG